jgi:tetratricopeptide (TPR) repeat protein
VAAGLVALVAAVYWRVGSFGFVDYDDGRYVFDNPLVRGGLTAEALARAFTTLHASNWHPLTWLSHLLDVTLFGLDPGWHHRVSVLWHGASAVLLFLVLRDATGATWRSALAAALFAVHPLNVESVAWIAERKNVLSTFFWIAATGAYVRYARRPSALRYLLVAGTFLLGLLSKPMVVTLPVVLLLLDVWPLRRVEPGALERPVVVRLALEKVPLLLLAAASGAITVVAQGRGGTLSSMDALALPVRLAHAALAYTWYLGKAVWPAKLAVFYPHPAWAPGGLSAWKVAAAAIFLAAATAASIRLWRSRPAVTVGWLWYLVTLLPVIGLVQVGLQGTADRYAYLPLVGIFVAAAWVLPVPAAWPRLAAGSAGLVLALAAVAHAQTRHWRDGRALFSHAAEVDPGNWLAWKNVGTYLFEEGRFQEALRAFEQAAPSRPWDPDIWSNIGLAHAAQGRHELVPPYLERSLRLRPDDADTWLNLAVAYALSGRPDRAREAARRLQEIDAARAAVLRERLEALERR